SPWYVASGVNMMNLPTLTPNHAGTYTVTLKVTTHDDGFGSASTTVVKTFGVTNVAPTPTVTGLASAVTGQPLTYTGTFTDPGQANDPGTGNPGETYTYLWKVTGPGGFLAQSNGGAYAAITKSTTPPW